MNKKNKTISTKDHMLTKHQFEIVPDNTTGVLKTKPTPGKTEIQKYYNFPTYDSYTDSPKTLIAVLYTLVRRITTKSKLKQIFSRHKSKGALLDVGCGTGVFLSKIKNEGWSATGIEPNHAARNFARKTNAQEVYSSKEDLKKTKKKFDVITLWHSLEHVHDLEETIRFLFNTLKAKGSVLVAVPNHRSFDAGHYKEFWAAYDVPRHIWHFSQDSIVNIFKKHGFEIKTKTPMFWDSFYVSILSEKYKEGSFPFLKGVFVGMFSNFLSFFTGESSSITYVFSKTNKTENLREQ